MAFEYELRCNGCESVYADSRIVFECDACRGLLSVVRRSSPARADFPIGRGSLWKYAAHLPVGDAASRVSLGEGGSPLVESSRIAREHHLGSVHLKCEHVNPTGSFKDRGVSVAVTAALRLGVKHVFCASSGNTAASVSAYAARARLRAVVILPVGMSTAKVSQALLHGATVFQVEGTLDEAMAVVTEIGRRGRYLVNSRNPYRIEGQKTTAFEIIEDMKSTVPDHVLVPAGSGGYLTALHAGFKESLRMGLIDRMPKLGAVQSTSTAPLVAAIEARREFVSPCQSGVTIAHGVNIADPARGREALRAIHDTGGIAVAVSDREIVAAQMDLARLDGIGVEATGAIAVAGLNKACAAGRIKPGESVICILTGHALKGPSATEPERGTAISLACSADAILDLIGSTGSE